MLGHKLVRLCHRSAPQPLAMTVMHRLKMIVAMRRLEVMGVMKRLKVTRVTQR